MFFVVLRFGDSYVLLRIIYASFTEFLLILWHYVGFTSKAELRHISKSINDVGWGYDLNSNTDKLKKERAVSSLFDFLFFSFEKRSKKAEKLKNEEKKKEQKVGRKEKP